MTQTKSTYVKISFHFDSFLQLYKYNTGFGRINYISPSCNDANLHKVTLQYDTGEIKIKNVLNASFFEYDLDKDGRPEQYIIAERNCTLELAIVRIL